MTEALSGWHGTVERWLGKLPADGRIRYVSAYRHGTLEVELYAPQGADKQTPHSRDELYVVAAGTGTFRAGGRAMTFKAGDALFVPAGMDHRFEDFNGHFATWVMFYGPEGGEAPDGNGESWHGTVGDWLAQVPDGEIRSVSAFRHGTLETKLYAPRGIDPQKPHGRDELYIVARGRGVADINGRRQSFGPADALFVPAGAEHRFVDFTDDLALWVMFYGPEGGEA